MNKAALKSYAPQARKDFIAAVTARANLVGLSEKAGVLDVAPAQPQGDVVVIAGQAWPIKVQAQREQLIKRIRKDGFTHTLEAVAYTWFNRFAALRYMELHDYLGHGHRALSSSAGGLPDILTHATDLANADNANALPGLNAAKVTELKLAGNRDGELYRMLLVAQCNALSHAMPFLFERIDDDTELLLPDNLLRTDSIIAQLVNAIDEDDWKEVEIIGWLYQFYISEKKDQVIGKVVKSEDIPAATQLFTPNWIVQYLVQNSVGRLWLMANTHSTLGQEWPYYIAPAEQTPEVQAQLDALIQTRVREDDESGGATLNPESITVLDPACGSGHILVVAYDVLKAIYLERGYRIRDIPRLILEKNLYGLDIDDRAAQMAGFALLMKARADDRRLFAATDDAGNLQPCSLNVLSLQESKGLSVDELATHLAPFKVQRATISALVDTFEHAKTFGSLIQIPYALKMHLAVLPQVLALVKQSGDMYASAAADDLLPLVQQAQVLAMQFDAVVANPPYMSSKGMNAALKEFAKKRFPNNKSDLFSIFIERCLELGRPEANLGFVTPYTWMFISSYEKLRNFLYSNSSVISLVKPSYTCFFESAIVPLVAYTIQNSVENIKGYYIDLGYLGSAESQPIKLLASINSLDSKIKYLACRSDFEKIPGSPLAFWVSDEVRACYKFGLLRSVADVNEGLKTGDNARFIKKWFEVNYEETNLTPSEASKWYKHTKGGGFKRWYGNCEDLLYYSNDGSALRAFPNASLTGQNNYLKENISWGRISSGRVSFRYTPAGSIPNMAGLALYPKNEIILQLLACLSSKCCDLFLSLTNPTLNFPPGTISILPIATDIGKCDVGAINRAIAISKEDWDSYECSWDFRSSPILSKNILKQTINASYTNWIAKNRSVTTEIKHLEEANNNFFINAYGLSDNLTPEVLDNEITLMGNPAYRYGGNQTEEDQWVRFQHDTMGELVSYAIGCMMGRYSLDEPGLIYAHAGNVGFDASRYVQFPADADGIVPITDELWFADDACSRIREFLRAVWGPDTLEENIAWLAESLGTKPAETPDETIRRYMAQRFFKDHLQTYKKRPIYWLFSSGKQGAFQALVYLHRYHEGTLSRLRAEYVVPLTGKIQNRIDMLFKDAAAASSTAVRNKLAKEIDKLKKKHTELLAYDEQLRHYADMRITLDLDDGVKVNYGKFGDLLDSVKVVTGGGGDE